jgi:hypothetical protein
MDSSKNLCFKAAGSIFGLCIALIGADAILSASDPRYPLWASQIAVGVYVTAGISVIIALCGILDISFPELGRRRL